MKISVMVIGAFAEAMVTTGSERNYEAETDPRRQRNCKKETSDEEEEKTKIPSRSERGLRQRFAPSQVLCKREKK